MFPVPDGAMSEQLQAQLQTQLQAVSAQLTAPGAPFELVSLDLAGQRYPLYKNAPLTLAALIEQGRGFGAKEFLVWQDMRWTYDEFFRHVDRLVMALRQTYGIQRGERVAIAMRNRPEWMAAYAAIILSGAVAVPLNSWGQREELVYGLQDSSPKLLFCDLPRLTHVITDLASLNLPAIVVDAAETARWPGVAHYLDVLDAAALLPSSPSAAAVSEPLAPEDLAMILYTSGTSSHPKGVVSTHRAMVQGIVNMEYFGALFVMTSPERFGAMMAAGFEMTTLMAVPLFHSSGLHAQFLSALRTGRRIVVMYKWEVGAVLELIAKERVTQLATAPAMMLQLLGDERFDAADTASLGWIGFGGAGIPERLIELVHEKKPRAIAGIGYGLTETNGPSNAATGEAFAHWPRSNGPTSPLFEVRILDDHGQNLPHGGQQRGEIWLRSVTLMRGYWNKEAATREVLVDGWFRTGDIGYFDAAGFLYVVDRIKDIVNRGGEKIASAEVESVLLQHPAIAEAAAFGVPDDTYGEALAVALHLKNGARLDADDVRHHVAAHLAPYKVPAHVHIHDHPLPRNVVGKVLKRQLREEFSA
ncbi:MAG: acyl--CoA ligase [Sterolibacterium sp.]|jgi:long-chain acyl-CoA synthetase|nr:acyl--CoA ligase [Sterolibacterium sp.]